jgi:hypothetical protein
MQNSVADARAELAEPPSPDDRRAERSAGDAARKDDSAGETSAVQVQSVIALRWPNQPTLSDSVLPPDPSDFIKSAAAMLRRERPAAPVNNTSTGDVFSELAPYRLQILLSSLAGALALVGIGGLAFKFHSFPRHLGKLRMGQRPIWESTDDDGIVLTNYSARESPQLRSHFPATSITR